MGDSITEGSLLKILVKPGSGVALDQIVATIETDKVRCWRCAPSLPLRVTAH